ncbi:MAG: N-acetylmuramoyl-L-alanine amidase [Actinomycetota bacterium]|nr:N-acetylmuramoyl-L-alanine amidase [Actinomycetota bacterium]
MLAGILVAGLLAAAALTTGAEAQETGCKVVLDAGHGGTDPGAVNAKYGLKEKEQTLNVALRLEALLEADGHPVCMTRREDKTLSNNDRYTYANTTGAKVLVSVHMNGSSETGTDYTTTLFGKWRKDKELAYAVYGDPAAKPPYGLVTLPAAVGPGTIAKRDPYSFASGVLLKSNMPATIAETVFITNDVEAEWLKNGRRMPDGTVVSRQQQIAEALRTGIENYLATHPSS